VCCRFDDVRGGRALAGRGLLGVLEAATSADVPGLLAEVDAATSSGLHAAGFVAYEAAPAFDRALHARPAGSLLPLAWFALYEELAPCSPLALPGAAPHLELEPECGRSDYAKAVAAIHEAIAGGLTYQVNYTTRLRFEMREEPLALYGRLSSAQQGGYHAYIETDRWAVACASPELFFRREGQVVTTRPMKGTAPRGDTPAEDAARAGGLRRSDKERCENVIVVDLLRNDLGRIASTGSVQVDNLFDLEPYPTVWQMTSTVSCRVAPATTLGELFGALFPCGSVTGAPKASTMSLIADLEASPRGVYCGAIGHAGRGPDGEISACFGVGIRTAVVDRCTGAAEYGVGSGITWYSDAGDEWAELWAKAAVLGTGAVQALPSQGAFPKAFTSPSSWTSQYPVPEGVGAIPTTGDSSGLPPSEPAYWAPPKLKTPPSEATIR
jgi:para-aminobenzoate synthetase / 4-amino-4-deoxychorismate lyase